MPRLWQDSVEAHRTAVRNATMDAAATLLAEHGPAALTMARIAQTAGIGRATLYKYFADVDAVLAAWLRRQVTGHLQHLADVADDASLEDRLPAVLAAYAEMLSAQPSGELAAALHAGEDVTEARHQLRAFVADLIGEAAGAGLVRRDVPPIELAAYCLHALAAATASGSRESVNRLVTVTLAGLHPRP